MKKNTIFRITFLLFLTQLTFAQETKSIFGKVTFDNLPLSNVNVVIKNTTIGVQTDQTGSYRIEAKVDDEILFSYVGLKTTSILVEDVTSLLNIKMIAEVNQLEDVVVKASSKNMNSRDVFLQGKEKLQTAVGQLNLASRGQVYYYGSRDLNLGATNLAKSLATRSGSLTADSDGNLYVRGVKAIWDIDEAIQETGFFVNTADVIDVYILTNAPTRYLSKSVVIVKTSQSSQIKKIEKDRITEESKNQNYFDENSVSTELNFAQHDITEENTNEKEVFGRVTFMDSSIPDVLVSIVDKKEFSVFSDVKGAYKIRASVGDIIQFVHVSFETVSIIVEDVTNELNIVLKQKINDLDQVVIESKRKLGKIAQQKKDADEGFMTSRGKKDPKKSGFSNTYVDGKTVSNIYSSIQEALVGKISGYVYDRTTGKGYLRGLGMSVTQDYAVAWEIDGVFTSNAPNIDLSDIKSIRALKSVGAANKYGTAAAGGVIIIETVYGGFDSKKVKKDKFLEEYANSNFYNDDATSMSLEKDQQNKYSLVLEAYKNKDVAYEFYTDQLKNKLTNYSDHPSIAMTFFQYHMDRGMATRVLNELAMSNAQNPEILKAIAYYFQLIEEKKSAVEVYQQIFRLRSKYAQSFRDLANAYVDYNLFEKSWKLYMGFMIKDYADSSEGIGELIYNDMEWLYFNRNNQTKIKQKFIPIYKNIEEFSNDVRLVFEWNTSEAEFELEFVNPDKRAYVFDHSLENNNELILQEKKMGYSSKLFFLEDIGNGEWLVNLTYKGNKKQVPTYLKLTTFYNWSKPNEKRKINVYKLELQDQKIRLLTVNKELPVFQN